ncbi:hypothetical protein TH24_21785 [Thalassospira xiamenensis]|nr:hypothetical protein TH24_21785 [Thalassospira xiamenensis]
MSLSLEAADLRRARHLKSSLLIGGGVINLFIGFVFLPLPPPFFGMVFIAIGIPMLAAGSKRARRFIQYLRWRYYRHNTRIEAVLKRLPGFLRRHGRKTRPEALHRHRSFGHWAGKASGASMPPDDKSKP